METRIKTVTNPSMTFHISVYEMRQCLASAYHPGARHSIPAGVARPTVYCGAVLPCSSSPSPGRVFSGRIAERSRPHRFSTHGPANTDVSTRRGTGRPPPPPPPPPTDALAAGSSIGRHSSWDALRLSSAITGQRADYRRRGVSYREATMSAGLLRATAITIAPPGLV